MRFDAEVRGGVGLRVEIENLHPLAEHSAKGGGEVDGGRCFADAPFLIQNSDPSHRCFLSEWCLCVLPQFPQCL